MLIMHRKCQTAEVVSLIHLYVERKYYIMSNKLKPAIVLQMFYLALYSGKKIVLAHYFIAPLK